MSVVFAAETALEIYLRNPDLASGLRCLLPDDGECSMKEVISAGENLDLGDDPLHILVLRSGARKIPNNQVISHFSTIREALFIRYKGCYLVSPELCFIQLARGRSFSELLRLGCLLCGDYRPSVVRFKEGSKPLTTLNKLRNFCDAYSGRGELKGFAAIRRALPHLVENSHSARESQLALMLSLPCRMGGYGLPKPLMNAQLLGSWREGDLVWLGVKLVVEYDSDLHHGNSTALGKDSSRRTEIELMGFRVITATNEQVSNFRLMDELAHLIAKCLGHRLRDSASTVARRRKLHRELFSVSQLARKPATTQVFPD